MEDLRVTRNTKNQSVGTVHTYRTGNRVEGQGAKKNGKAALVVASGKRLSTASAKENLLILHGANCKCPTCQPGLVSFGSSAYYCFLLQM